LKGKQALKRPCALALRKRARRDSNPQPSDPKSDLKPRKPANRRPDPMLDEVVMER